MQNQQQPSSQTTKNTKKFESDTNIIVNFLDLDTSKFSFNTPKRDDNNNLNIPLRYDGKMLTVKYPKMRLPFGIGKNTVKLKKQDADFSKYLNGEKLTGFSARFCYEKNLQDCYNNPYFQKANELDEFFIKKCAQNATAFGQQGTSEDQFRGCDEYGTGGKWKRFNKFSYKVDQKTQAKIYSTEYSAGIEIGIYADLKDVDDPETGLKTRQGPINIDLYDKDSKSIPNLNTENYMELVPKFSEASCLADWPRLSSGTYGVSLKGRGKQMRVWCKDSFPKECLLDDDDDDNTVADNTKTVNAPALEEFENSLTNDNYNLGTDDENSNNVSVQQPVQVQPAKPRTLVRRT